MFFWDTVYIDNVYGAVIMLEALREFTMVHAMSAARRQVAADLWTKPISA